MRAGLCRKRIRVEAPSRNSSDSLGDSTPTWAEVLTTMAAIEPYTGEEFLEGQQVTGKTLHRVTTRWCSELAGITANHRIRVSNDDSPETWRTFDVIAPLNLESRNRWLEIVASERP